MALDWVGPEDTPAGTSTSSAGGAPSEVSSPPTDEGSNMTMKRLRERYVIVHENAGVLPIAVGVIAALIYQAERIRLAIRVSDPKGAAADRVWRGFAKAMRIATGRS